MRIEFTLTQEDVADLQALASKDENVRSLRRKKAISTMLFLALAAVFFIVRRDESPPPTLIEPAKPGNNAGNIAVFAVCLLLAAGSLIWIFIVSPKRRMGKALWENLPGLHLPQTVEMTDEGLSRINPVSRSTWAWNVLCGIDETDRLLVIRFGDAESLLIPKYSVPSDKLDAMRVTLRDKLESAIASSGSKGVL